MKTVETDRNFEIQDAYISFFALTDRLLKTADDVRKEREHLLGLIKSKREVKKSGG